MLHVGILPNHRAWADFLHRLDVVVVDEAHVYRGVFGSHVGNVLRRLRRMAPHARFFMASATIANPVELAERLTGLDDIALVENDGSPKARRRIAMWNPPVIDEALGMRRSALAEAADVIVDLVRNDTRSICFIKSRKAVELTAKIVQDRLADTDPKLANAIAPYRAGYTAAQRREIEHRLVSGDLRAVITTDALELGIDIGALDAAVVVTFPGTVASLQADVGPCGAARPRAGGVRRRRGRARPVLLPPSRRLPRPQRRGGDPRPRVRADPPAAPAVRRARGAAQRARRGGARAELETHARALEAAGELRGRAAGSSCSATPRTIRPRACRCVGASPDSFAVVDVSSRRDPRHGRVRARVLAPCTTARSTCTSGARTR